MNVGWSTWDDNIGLMMKIHIAIAVIPVGLITTDLAENSGLALQAAVGTPLRDRMATRQGTCICRTEDTEPDLTKEPLVAKNGRWWIRTMQSTTNRRCQACWKLSISSPHHGHQTSLEGVVDLFAPTTHLTSAQRDQFRSDVVQLRSIDEDLPTIE